MEMESQIKRPPPAVVEQRRAARKAAKRLRRESLIKPVNKRSKNSRRFAMRIAYDGLRFHGEHFLMLKIVCINRSRDDILPIFVVLKMNIVVCGKKLHLRLISMACVLIFLTQAGKNKM